MWLISFRWKVHSYHHGVLQLGETYEDIEVSEKHPAQWLASMMTRFRRPLVSDEKVYGRRDEVLAILSAVEIPPGMLTDAELELLNDR